MKWKKNFRVGNSLRGNRAELIDEAENRSWFSPWYVITPAMNNKNLLDIRSTRSLSGNNMKEKLPLIVGLAGSEREALEMVRDMVQECLDQTGGLDLCTYLTER